MSRPGVEASDGLLLAAVLLVAVNLRGAIAAVAPVLPEVRADLSLSATTAGLLTTLPVLCFAAAAPAAGRLSRWTGLEAAVLVACVALTLGTVLRPVAGAPLLLAGTVLVGLAITLGNVVLPVVIKRDFPARAGTLSGVYAGVLGAGAALTAGLTAPIAELWGWRVGLAVWAVLALVSAGVWHVAARERPATGETHPCRPAAVADVPAPGDAGDPGLWTSPVAWAVTLFLAGQSFAYYSVTAWLPTLLSDAAGLGLAAAGGAMSVFQLLGIGGSFLMAVLAGRRERQGWLGASAAGGWLVMMGGLLLWPGAWPAWVLVGGLAQGAGISFVFTVLVLRAHDAAAARVLSGMAQLVGYTFGAAGPFVFGTLYQATRGWAASLGVLLAVVTCMAVLALVAGRDTTVGARATARQPSDR